MKYASSIPLNSLRFRLHWQRELERGAPSCVAARPQTPAVGRDDPPTNGQSHAGAARFRGEERLENALGIVDRKPYSRITHRNQQLTILGPLRRDGQFAARLLHRLDAVEHEVDQDLLQLNAICCRRRKLRIEVGVD
jgi:hypothetical protein